VEKKKFTTTLDGDLIKQLKIVAVEQNTSVAGILEQLIKEYLTKQPTHLY
jgi:predicted transcriptional regulator